EQCLVVLRGAGLELLQGSEVVHAQVAPVRQLLVAIWQTEWHQFFQDQDEGTMGPRPSAAQACGSASSAQYAYRRPAGCSPSPATSEGSVPARREIGVTSTQRAPAAAAPPRAARLNWSMAAAICPRSRPSAKGITPQSGIESTSTRDGSRPANPTARWRRASNPAR